jgi:hypothetical protein
MMGTHRQKKYPRTAGVSARWFDATNDKKARIHLKTHLLSAGTLISCAWNK